MNTVSTLAQLATPFFISAMPPLKHSAVKRFPSPLPTPATRLLSFQIFRRRKRITSLIPRISHMTTTIWKRGIRNFFFLEFFIRTRRLMKDGGAPLSRKSFPILPGGVREEQTTHTHTAHLGLSARGPIGAHTPQRMPRIGRNGAFNLYSSVAWCLMFGRRGSHSFLNWWFFFVGRGSGAADATAGPLQRENKGGPFHILMCTLGVGIFIFVALSNLFKSQLFLVISPMIFAGGSLADRSDKVGPWRGALHYGDLFGIRNGGACGWFFPFLWRNGSKTYFNAKEKRV